MKQHILKVENSTDINFLNDFGRIEYVAKLNNLIVFHPKDQESVDQLSKDKRIVSIRESRTGTLCEDKTMLDEVKHLEELAQAYVDNAEEDAKLAEELMAVSWEVDQMDDSWE